MLNFIGSLFVYRSPNPKEGFESVYRSILMEKTNRELRKIVGTNSHYSKTMLVNMIIDDNT
tara:strand:+ start:297 stop:479 length:183 start_codon:yes stop_codon:yes gene_type:complete